MKDIPERIWLQVGEDLDEIESFNDLDWEYVTWASNSINNNDIEYIRVTPKEKDNV